MEIIYKVVSTGLRIRLEPNLNSTVLGSLDLDSQITINDLAKCDKGYTWGKHDGGWSSIMSPDGHQYMTKVSDVSTPTVTTTPTGTIDTPLTTTYTLATTTNRSTAYVMNSDNKYALKKARSRLGLPAQFTGYTDPKIPGTAFGRTYTENILMNMPICMITPGGPKFLGGNVKKDSDEWTGFLNLLLTGNDTTTGGSSLSNILDRLLDGEVARYYTFKPEFSDYIDIVNGLNRTTAYYFGVQDRRYFGTGSKYSELDWQNVIKYENNEGLINFLGAFYGAIPFYYDKNGTSTSMSGSNSTDKSMLDGLLQTASSGAKEAAFITNSFAGKSFNNIADSEKKINQLTLNLANSSGMIDQIMTNLRSGITTVASGSNLLLPEIWKDSSNSNPYSLDFHFASPYGTAESVYLNCAVPLNFILGLAFPRQFGANGYSSPFLIQAFAQGLFNCSLGIIDSVSISKFGSGDAMTKENLPMEIKVSVSFKDLYNSFSITNAKNTALFANNIELIDYISTLAGVSVAEPDFKRKLRLFLDSKMNTIKDAPENAKLKINDWLRDKYLNMIKF